MKKSKKKIKKKTKNKITKKRYNLKGSGKASKRTKPVLSLYDIHLKGMVKYIYNEYKVKGAKQGNPKLPFYARKVADTDDYLLLCANYDDISGCPSRISPDDIDVYNNNATVCDNCRIQYYCSKECREKLYENHITHYKCKGPLLDGLNFDGHKDPHDEREFVDRMYTDWKKRTNEKKKIMEDIRAKEKWDALFSSEAFAKILDIKDEDKREYVFLAIEFMSAFLKDDLEEIRFIDVDGSMTNPALYELTQRLIRKLILFTKKSEIPSSPYNIYTSLGIILKELIDSKNGKTSHDGVYEIFLLISRSISEELGLISQSISEEQGEEAHPVDVLGAIEEDGETDFDKLVKMSTPTGVKEIGNNTIVLFFNDLNVVESERLLTSINTLTLALLHVRKSHAKQANLDQSLKEYEIELREPIVKTEAEEQARLEQARLEQARLEQARLEQEAKDKAKDKATDKANRYAAMLIAEEKAEEARKMLKLKESEKKINDARSKQEKDRLAEKAKVEKDRLAQEVATEKDRLAQEVAEKAKVEKDRLEQKAKETEEKAKEFGDIVKSVHIDIVRSKKMQPDIDRVQNILDEYLKKEFIDKFREISLYGSRAANLALPSSDSDIMIHMKEEWYEPQGDIDLRERKVKVLNNIRDSLSRYVIYFKPYSIIENIVVTPKNKSVPPIIKLRLLKGDGTKDIQILEIDIGINDHLNSGDNNVLVMNELNTRYPILQYILLYFKKYLRQLLPSVVDTYLGGLNSSTLIILIVYFLFENDDKMKDEELDDIIIGRKIIEFLKWSCEFDAETTPIYIPFKLDSVPDYMPDRIRDNYGEKYPEMKATPYYNEEKEEIYKMRVWQPLPNSGEDIVPNNYAENTVTFKDYKKFMQGKFEGEVNLKQFILPSDKLFNYVLWEICENSVSMSTEWIHGLFVALNGKVDTMNIPPITLATDDRLLYAINQSKGRGGYDKPADIYGEGNIGGLITDIKGRESSALVIKDAPPNGGGKKKRKTRNETRRKTRRKTRNKRRRKVKKTRKRKRKI